MMFRSTQKIFSFMLFKCLHHIFPKTALFGTFFQAASGAIDVMTQDGVEFEVEAYR